MTVHSSLLIQLHSTLSTPCTGSGLSPAGLLQIPLSLLLAETAQGAVALEHSHCASPEARDQSPGFRTLGAMDGKQLFGEKTELERSEHSYRG